MMAAAEFGFKKLDVAADIQKSNRNHRSAVLAEVFKYWTKPGSA